MFRADAFEATRGSNMALAHDDMNSIVLTVLWTDSDEMLQLGIRLSSRAHMLYHETYIYPDELMAFAKGMMTFPQNANSEVTMESGSRDPKLSDYIRLRAFVLTPNGHSAIEVESQIPGAAPLLAENHFYIPGLSADFDRLGADMAKWLGMRDEPLQVEWRDG
jgi:hypothetical protein